MIEKFLIRFCASEVRIMVTRLHERPDDFTYGTRWRDLAATRKGFTWAERKVLDIEWTKFNKNQKRRELLGLITQEVLNPTPKDQWGLASHSNFQALQGQYTASMSTAQMNAYLNAAQIRAQQMSGYTDPHQLALFQGGNRNV